MPPWLSVVMPTYNGADFIGESLSSLANQTRTDFECIVVDQGSTDGTLDIVADFQSTLSISVISAPNNRNWMANTNLGIEKAASEFISMLHQDDVWRSDRAELMFDLTRKTTDAQLYFHPVDFIDSTGGNLGVWSCPIARGKDEISSQNMLEKLLIQNFISIPAALFRRSDALEIGGFDTELWYTGDWDFYLRLVKLGKSAYLPKRLAGFRIHRSSLTVSGSKNPSDFAQQLSIPLTRHLPSLEDATLRTKIEKVGRVSNDVNVLLAQLFHKDRPSIWPTAAKFAALGPSGWHRYFHNSRILQRIFSRIRLNKEKK